MNKKIKICLFNRGCGKKIITEELAKLCKKFGLKCLVVIKNELNNTKA